MGKKVEAFENEVFRRILVLFAGCEWHGEDYIYIRGTAVAQWLRCCATNRNVAGSIPDGVIGIFH